MNESKTMDGACHCGAVRFTVKLNQGLEKPRRCNCSLCRMRGAVMVTAFVGDLTVTAGQDVLRLYQFNTKTAEHYFCSVCGIYTHNKRRSDPTTISVNAACLTGVTPFDFECVPVYEGVLHPADRQSDPGYRVAGYIKYEGVERAKT